MDTAPLEKDILNYITPNYATKWREIGTLLDLSSEKLKIIQYDCMDKAEACCNETLRYWLRIDATATWRKLLDVIKSPAVDSKSIAVDIKPPAVNSKPEG